MKKVMFIFGTRPEAIKLAPVVNHLKNCNSRFETLVCVTAQHRQMLDQVLHLFRINPDYDLDIMTENQGLFDITIECLNGLGALLSQTKPDLVLVQGDTTTTFVASLAAFYLKIPIGHVEAGLRTHDKYQPFPEEKNRHMASTLVDYHFAPTAMARNNLIREDVSPKRIWVTGNTGIDALMQVVGNIEEKERHWQLDEYFRDRWDLPQVSMGRKLILITGHRRENFGEGFRNICLALEEIARSNPEVDLVYPVHLNPNVRGPVLDILDKKKTGHDNIYLIDPLDYEPFVHLMYRSYFILTDSGGIQEEAPALGKPVLIFRNTTERVEGIESGNCKLVGTNPSRIVEETQRLLDDTSIYLDMASKQNPYGDGKAAKRIVKIIETLF